MFDQIVHSIICVCFGLNLAAILYRHAVALTWIILALCGVSIALHFVGVQ